jgi:hypothetical protein
MVEMADIKNDLPDWPDDVIEQWLHYFAQDCGWPPPEPLGNHRWKGLLGGKPLSWWKKVSWKKRKSNAIAEPDGEVARRRPRNCRRDEHGKGR